MTTTSRNAHAAGTPVPGKRASIRREVLPDDALPTECDLVMKGGITSGIVYPRAIAGFARRFRLRSIGGASAGAIAAAAAAAAQYGKNHGVDRFETLEALPEWLAEDGGDGRTRLLHLFQPQPRLRRLYRWLLAGLSPDVFSRWRSVARWLLKSAWHYWSTALAAVVVAGGLYAVARALSGMPLLPETVTGWVLLAAFGLLSLVAGGMAGVACALLCTVPKHLYGICDGMTHADDGTPALTPWLHGLIQDLAGRGAAESPLTFGDLWGAVEGDAGDDHPGADNSAHRDIDLRVMTTALSQARPYSLPFEPGDTFHFDETEFRRLFPAEVVDWMLAHPAKIREKSLLAGRHPLPAMADLPIVVAARMSLSFPVLIAAVPLYRSHRVSKREEKVWFSDGGLCSNFPVHYFDAPLPSRPTFAINLHSESSKSKAPTKSTKLKKLKKGSEPRSDPQDFVFLQRFNAGGQDHQVVDIEGRSRRLGGFLGAIIETLHNWSDNTQLRVPGFRDRVAHVRLQADEGGLNLRMRRELILRVAERGRHAATRLIEGFLPRQPYEHHTTWQNHRWVRFRTSFMLLEESLAGVLASHRRFAGLATSIDALHSTPPSYSYSLAQAAQSQAAYDQVIALAEALEQMRANTTPPGDALFNPRTSSAPSPRSQLRIRPRM